MPPQARNSDGLIMSNREHLRERLQDVAYGAVAILALEGVIWFLSVTGRL